MQLSFDFAVDDDDGSEEVKFDNNFAEVGRYNLDETSWIEVVPHLIRHPERLFAQLLDALGWHQRQRWMYDQRVDEPRLTASYPNIETAPVEALGVLARRLSAAYDIPYDGLWVNLYRDERDSTGWHGDKIT